MVVSYVPYYLVIQLAKKCHSSVDPMVLIGFDGQFYAEHVVCGVTGGGECASSRARLVHCTHVYTVDYYYYYYYYIVSFTLQLHSNG